VSRVTVVTGAAGAMGSACAEAMGPSRDVLLLTDRDGPGLAVTADRLRAVGSEVVTLDGDIAEPVVIDRLRRRAADLGTLHSLVHTAGLSPSMADWEEILRVDLAGVVRLLDAFVANVVTGSVAVCLASVSAHMGTFDPAMDTVLDAPLEPDLAERFRTCFGGEPDPGSTYRLAKRGVVRACERAAVGWGAGGARVLSLSPGLIDTGMGRLELAENPVKEHLAELTPLTSTRQGPDPVLPGHTGDVADAVAFLCSERAAFISGCDIRVDGGLIAAMNRPVGISSADR
jgi:NAD(P)-dependent dehydrogenase (short-subunit alcohol dehydrogenase family)